MLTHAQALDLYQSDDLIGIGMEADAVRRKLHPEDVAPTSSTATSTHRYFLGLLSAIAKVDGHPLNAQGPHALEDAPGYFRGASPKHTADEEQSFFPPR